MDEVEHEHAAGGNWLHGSQPWRERRKAQARRAALLAGEGYVYRAGELLVASDDEQRVINRLRQLGGRPDEQTNEELDAVGLGVRLWRFPGHVGIPGVLGRLRAAYADQGEPAVAPNHAFSGEPFYHGGPGSFPKRARELPDELSSPPPVDRPDLAVMDTGVPRQLASWHPRLAARLLGDADDLDVLDVDGDQLLDAEAGHGTFICGLVRRVAPALTLDPERVLDSFGFGNDLALAKALICGRAPVLNLSLGGYTEDDRPPLATATALRALSPDVVVVAAAGNHGSDRPFWPAAFDDVYAVAAVDTTVRPRVPAGFSNFGPWVDLCAPGVDLHAAYVKGRRQDEDGSEPLVFDGWASWSGTSFAAPLFAAAIAAKVAEGEHGPDVAAALCAGLSPLPGHPQYGRFYDPGLNLSDG